MKKRHKILIAVLTVVIIIESIGLTFAYKFYHEQTVYSPEIHTVEDFYKIPHLQNPEVIKSLYFNAGTFEFLFALNDRNDKEMQFRYLKIYPSKYQIDYQLIKDTESYDPRMLIGEPYIMTAVFLAPEDEVYENILREYKYFYHCDSDVVYTRAENVDVKKTFAKFWDEDKYDVEFDRIYCEGLSYDFYISTDNSFQSYKSTYVFVSKPVNGQVYVFAATNGLGFSDTSNFLRWERMP